MWRRERVDRGGFQIKKEVKQTDSSGHCRAFWIWTSGKRRIPTQSEEVDASALQYQNQQLVQQLDSQKKATHQLEKKCEELQEKQKSYDQTLIAINKIWNLLVDDLVLLGIRAGADSTSLQALEYEQSYEDVVSSCKPEEAFLCRLLGTSAIRNNGQKISIKHVQDALALRHSRTMELMKNLEEMIAEQRVKAGRLVMVLRGSLSSEEAVVQLQEVDDSLREEVNNLRQVIEILHLKHNLYTEEISSYIDSRTKDQFEIKRLSSELEESMTELEESRRKLVILQLQQKGASAMTVSVVNVVNGGNSPRKPTDMALTLRDLKEAVEEAKVLTWNREFELEEAREDNLNLSKQLEELENELKDDKYVLHSKPYAFLKDQLQHLNTELERYKDLIEPLQADRNHLLKKEKELSAKEDALDTVKSSITNYEARIEELELQIQRHILERNELQIKLEETLQDSGRNDIKDEINVMATALSKEKQMMEAQLNRSKEVAQDALTLHHECNSLKAKVDDKIAEHKSISDKCAHQDAEIKSLKELIEKLERGKQELLICLDMYGQEPHDNRTIMEIKESEQRAQLQAELLRNAFDEHSLQLRVRAANEAEAACQKRLATAEAEIAELREKLDASERDLLRFKEAIRIKDADAEAYISEIETIGQAYEDMQTQNQRLLQQLANRDDYNIKLVSDSVKMKQIHSSLLCEKQEKETQLQQLGSSLELLMTKIARGEQQLKAYLAQAAKTSIENKHIAIEMDKTKLELVDSERELKWLRSAVDSAEKECEHNQHKILELRINLERERNERKRLEEEYEELNNEVMEMCPERVEAAIQKLQDEIKECKAILKCGVCFDRPKERNLEIRHRKCPGCGTPFGQNDVREVNI
ncbi:E3 ubiquitin-protein ligase BRE1-like 2 [Apostasia shenzhenica]|uniref:E3 ubiquitin protein ligase n=1 Tax=Apostasia shenzhenica TaxID=1088818 RepID=A0A2H9ZRZ0_9ASPA|nr:E3 ubiquitin-protein ligase BRE1-like 2 [Apostasia shenzhenica]